MAVMIETNAAVAGEFLLNQSVELLVRARVAEGLQVVVVEDRDKAPSASPERSRRKGGTGEEIWVKIVWVSFLNQTFIFQLNFIGVALFYI